jgi:hypothetical protein
MKYQMKIRSVPTDTVDAKQSRFLSTIHCLNNDWGVSSTNAQRPEFGTELSACFPLGKQLGKGISGAITYRFRGGLTDIGECDDMIDLEFQSNRPDIQHVLDTVFPSYCEAFDGYYGYIGNEEYVYTDFELSRNRNVRKGIVRVHQANYFNNEYFRRITRGRGDSWLSELSDQGWAVSLLKDGVLVRWGKEILTYEKGEEVNRVALGALEHICVA